MQFTSDSDKHKNQPKLYLINNTQNNQDRIKRNYVQRLSQNFPGISVENYCIVNFLLKYT